MSPALDFQQPDRFRGERRRHTRYRISAAAQIFLPGIRCEAVTLDISSGGVLLKSGGFLPVGRQVQLLVDWPTCLNERCALRLVIEGVILRSNADGTAIGIIRYDYRNRSQTPAPVMAYT
jgi:hypothetical protein